jgi:TolB-like protein
MNPKMLLFVGAVAAQCQSPCYGQVSTGWSPDWQPFSALGSSFQIDNANSTARFNQLAAFVADQLTHNWAIKNISGSRIAVTSFVALQTLGETDKVGLALEERMMHEMQSRGFSIVDYKITGSLKIRETGDFIYSRTVGELRNEYNVHYFLTGVIESSADGYVVHARLVDASNNLLVSSAQAFLNGPDAIRILGDFRPTPTATKVMNVVGKS